MAAPYAPVITSPAGRGAGDSTSGFTMSWLYSAFTAGDDQDDYVIRRRQLLPSVGSYEYWGGSSWTTETWIAGTAESDTEFTTGTLTGWTANYAYELSVKVRNAASEESAYSNPVIVYTHAAPSLTLAISSLAVTRPTIKWTFSGGTDRYQRSVQLKVFTTTESNRSGFDPANPGYFPVWEMDVPMFTSRVFNKKIGADLESGVQYKAYYNVTDDRELASGWTLGSTFTMSYTRPEAPPVTLTPYPELGYVAVDCRSAGNLLDTNSASFSAGLGVWEDPVRTGVRSSWDQANKRMLLTVSAGLPYDDLDAAHTTYDAEDTAYTDYDDMKTTEVSDTWLGVFSSNAPEDYIAVEASTAYSMIGTLTALTFSGDVRFQIEWYTSAKSPISTSTSSTSALTANTPLVKKYENVTSPATAAYARLGIQMENADVEGDDVLAVDNMGFAAGTTIEWTAGASEEGTALVVQRSDDGGQTWSYLPYATDDEPFVAGLGDSAIVFDRWIPLGFNASGYRYKVYSIQDHETAPNHSLPTEASISSLNLNMWWLRSDSYDLRVYPEGKDFSEKLNNEVLLPTQGSTPIIVNSSVPQDRQIKMSFWVFDDDDLATMEAMLRSEESIYVQTNWGPGAWFRPTGSFSVDARTTVSGIGRLPKGLYKVRVSGQVVG